MSPADFCSANFVPLPLREGWGSVGVGGGEGEVAANTDAHDSVDCGDDSHNDRDHGGTVRMIEVLAMTGMSERSVGGLVGRDARAWFRLARSIMTVVTDKTTKSSSCWVSFFFLVA